jgi:hypothetical protein
MQDLLVAYKRGVTATSPVVIIFEHPAKQVFSTPQE